MNQGLILGALTIAAAKRSADSLYHYCTYIAVVILTFFLPFTHCVMMRIAGTPNYSDEASVVCTQLVLSAYFHYVEEQVIAGDTTVVLKLIACAYESSENEGMAHHAIMASVFTATTMEVLGILSKIGRPLPRQTDHLELLMMGYFASLAWIIIHDCWVAPAFKYHSIAALGVIALFASPAPAGVQQNVAYVRTVVGLPALTHNSLPALPPSEVPVGDLLLFDDTIPNPTPSQTWTTTTATTT